MAELVHSLAHRRSRLTSAPSNTLERARTPEEIPEKQDTADSTAVNRYYDPATAQFLSVDPDVATTGEPYAFVGNDPLNATDPLGLSRVCRRGRCTGTSTSRAYFTLKAFSRPSVAEKYVARIAGGTRHPPPVATPVGGRNIDVLVNHPKGPTAIEVKTGSQSLSSTLKKQISKDVSLQNQGYETQWDFYPNGNGITNPSGPLLNALNDAKIDVNIYNYGRIDKPDPVLPF
jgi:uncharacterized protein RhaS with RHS repeats